MEETVKAAGSRGLGSDVRQATDAIQRDVNELIGAIKREKSQLERRVRERPIVALGAAFGVGFVLGGGLASRIGGWLLVTGLRFVAAQAVRQFTGQLTGQLTAEEPHEGYQS